MEQKLYQVSVNLNFYFNNVFHLVKPVRSTQCTLCKYVIAYVEAVIQTNKSEAAVESALEKVCTILPHALNHSCVQFVDTYTPQIIEYIAKSETPGQVCDSIKVCNNGTVFVKPVARKFYLKYLTKSNYSLRFF